MASSPDSAPPSSSQPSTLMSSLFDSLFQPGLNTPAKTIMHRSFAALILVLLSLLLATRNIHVAALLCIAGALWGSVAWFLAELAKMPPSVREPQRMPDVDSVDHDKKE